MATVLTYDKYNKHVDFKYIARTLDTKELVIGNIVVEQLWYQEKHYFMYYNAYASGGFCGGCVDQGIKKVEIDVNTVVPFTQLSYIKYEQEHNCDVKLIGLNILLHDEVTIHPIDSFHDYSWTEDLYPKIDMIEIENKLGNFGNRTTQYIKANEYHSKKSHNEMKEEADKREKLYQAILEFWTLHKGKYCSVKIVFSNDDYEYITEESSGLFSSSLLSNRYVRVEDAIRSFANLVNPDEVGAFDYGEIRHDLTTRNNVIKRTSRDINITRKANRNENDLHF